MEVKKKMFLILLAGIMGISLIHFPVCAKALPSVQANIIMDNVYSTTSSAIDVETWKYEGKGFTVVCKVTDKWEHKIQGEFILTNTGDEALENWSLRFDTQLDISSLWNATIEKCTEEEYFIKNAGFNQDIPVGGSVSIGFQARYASQISSPVSYELICVPMKVPEEKYAVSFEITDDWSTGYTGEISITNNSIDTIEDWCLKFDFEHQIDSFWTATIGKHEGETYTVKNAGYNANIAPGETLKLGFAGMPGDVKNKASNFKLIKIGSEEEHNLSYYIDQWLASDVENGDFDNDGLLDWYEFAVVDSNPLEADTDNDGINDGQEDNDQDGLLNQEEFKHGTDPCIVDTDDDGINDYDEIKLGANPLVRDSDSDGLEDKMELDLKTSPTNPDTNGNGVLDGDEVYEVHKDCGAGGNIRVLLEIKIEGSQVKNISIRELDDDDFFLPANMPGFICNGYDFSLSGEFEDATLKYVLDDATARRDNINPVVYYCDEENQILEPVENQVYDASTQTVTAHLKHFSKYILLDKFIFDAAFKEQIFGEVSNEEMNTPIDLVFVLDESGSMSWNDSQGIRKSII